MIHPLAKLLGSDWLWLHRPETDTIVVLHSAGAWFEVDASEAWLVGRTPPWDAIAIAMRGAGPGCHVLEVGVTDGVPYARAVLVAGAPIVLSPDGDPKPTTPELAAEVRAALIYAYREEARLGSGGPVLYAEGRSWTAAEVAERLESGGDVGGLCSGLALTAFRQVLRSWRVGAAP